MKFSEYINKHHANNWYKYVGTIYGPESWECTGREIAGFMNEFSDNSPLIDHPTSGGSDGFYFESGDIWVNGPDNYTELVFISD